MNDDDLITAVRESFTDVHSTTPAAQIVKRGRAVRARRRVPGVAAAVGAAAAAAVAVSVALPASHPAASRPGGRAPGGQQSWCPAGGLDCHPAGRRQHQGHLPRSHRRGRAAAHAAR